MSPAGRSCQISLCCNCEALHYRRGQLARPNHSLRSHTQTALRLQVKVASADFDAVRCGRTASVSIEKTFWRNGGERSFAAGAREPLATLRADARAMHLTYLFMTSLWSCWGAASHALEAGVGSNLATLEHRTDVRRPRWIRRGHRLDLINCEPQLNRQRKDIDEFRVVRTEHMRAQYLAL